MSEMALATRGLNKSFGSLIVAADIELNLPQGVRYALIGPNGAGKTTLINLITGMLRPSAGRILLGGRVPVNDVPPGGDVVGATILVFQIIRMLPDVHPQDSFALQ